MAISDRRFFLREHTRASHDELDSRIGAFHSAEDYVAYLRGIARFRLSAEAWMDGVAVPHPTWRPRRLADLLRSDLADLSLPAPAVGSLSVVGQTPSHVLGALYVIEGAVLGGQVLALRARALGFDAGFGARHLADAEKGLSSWRGYLTALDGVEPYDQQAALSAANAMFAAAATMFADAASTPDRGVAGEDVGDRVHHLVDGAVGRQVAGDVMLKARQIR